MNKFFLSLLLSLLASLGLLASPCYAKFYAGEDKYRPITSYYEGRFIVHYIKENIYAIGEPQYYQHNYSYLIIGDDKALMIDAGANTDDDIMKVVKGLTNKPVSVFPTHLHFDHMGGINRFDDVWLLDTPDIRSFKQADGLYHIPETRTLGFINTSNFQFKLEPLKVRRLIAPDETIDLGGKLLKVILTPGHAPEETVIYDITDNILFAGDYICPTVLLNSNTVDYLASTNKVLELINKDTAILAAHPDKNINSVPVVKYSDMMDFKAFLVQLQDNRLKGELVTSKEYRIKSTTVYKVNDRISFATDIIWENGTKYEF